MADHIVIGSSTAKGLELQAAVQQAYNLRATLREHKEIMDEMIDGADYSAVEAAYNLQAGDGTLVYNLLAGAAAAVEAAAVQQFTARLG